MRISAYTVKPVSIDFLGGLSTHVVRGREIVKLCKTHCVVYVLRMCSRKTGSIRQVPMYKSWCHDGKYRPGVRIKSITHKR